jgi:competence protein ComEA
MSTTTIVRAVGVDEPDSRPVGLLSRLRARCRLPAVAMAGVVAAAVAAGTLMSARGPAAPAPAAVPAVAGPAPATLLLVFVSGAVAQPGLYHLAAGARVADAIADAGGILGGADLGRLPDMAAVVHDGHQVNVPFAKSAAARTAARVDANSAGADELATIPGMTAELARAIVDARAAWGPFANLADLRGALGLDASTAALIGRHLRFLTAIP